MKTERACRECGCTQERACLVAGSPCSWVAFELCSACASQPRAALAGLSDDDLAQLAARDIAPLASRDLSVTLPVGQWWLVLAYLQLALRHPQTQGLPTAVVVGDIVQNLAGAIARSPAQREVVRRGCPAIAPAAAAPGVVS